MKFLKVLAIGILAIATTSCVSKKQYDALNLNYKQCIDDAAARQRDLQDLKSQNSSLTSENNLLRSQQDALNLLWMRVWLTKEKARLISINWWARLTLPTLTLNS